MIRIARLVVMILVLSSCATQPPVPQDHFYRLAPPSVANLGLNVNGVIAVAAIRTEGIYRERSILFVDHNLPLEIQRYNYHYWQSEPSALLQEQLVAFARHANVGNAIIRYRPAINSDWLIRGQLLRFERETAPAGNTVRIALELQWWRPNAPSALFAKEYYASIETRFPMHDAVAGFSAALDNIFGEFFIDAARYVDQHASSQSPSQAQ